MHDHSDLLLWGTVDYPGDTRAWRIEKNREHVRILTYGKVSAVMAAPALVFGLAGIALVWLDQEIIGLVFFGLAVANVCWYLGTTASMKSLESLGLPVLELSRNGILSLNGNREHFIPPFTLEFRYVKDYSPDHYEGDVSESYWTYFYELQIDINQNGRVHRRPVIPGATTGIFAIGRSVELFIEDVLKADRAATRDKQHCYQIELQQFTADPQASQPLKC